ncbi:hypothetical protein P691DRAFT_804821, partial [Macrolepiota fuliginosa MF-IS2]
MTLDGIPHSIYGSRPGPTSPLRSTNTLFKPFYFYPPCIVAMSKSHCAPRAIALSKLPYCSRCSPGNVVPSH